MSDLLPITIEEQIAEVERELSCRRSVYKRQVAANKMSPERADRQIAVMEAVLVTLSEHKRCVTNAVNQATNDNQETVSGSSLARVVRTLSKVSKEESKKEKEEESNQERTKSSVRSVSEEETSRTVRCADIGVAERQQIPDVRSELWSEGVEIVQGLTGYDAHRCRTLVGGWLKRVDDNCALLMSILHEARAVRPVDIMSWIPAAIKWHRRPKFKSGWLQIAAEMGLLDGRAGSGATMAGYSWEIDGSEYAP